MTNSQKLKILSPLIFFVFHVAYLVALSPDPFLKKWIDGSFTFFAALVLCNIIRARIVAASSAAEETPEDPGTREAGAEDPDAR
jgi:hypothetical protein